MWSTLRSLAVEAWRLSRRNRLNLLLAVVILAAALMGCLFSAGMQSALFADDGSVLPKGTSIIGVHTRENGLTFMTDADVLDLRAEKLPATAQMIAFRRATFSVADADNQRVSSALGTWIDAPLFSSLNWSMALGRDFNAADFHGEFADPSGSDVAIIGHQLWVTRFASRPDVIGQSIQIDGASRKVIGVLPPYRAFPVNQTIYLPFKLSDVRTLGNRAQSPRLFNILARVADAQARGEIKAALERVDSKRSKRLTNASKLEPLRLMKLRASEIADSESRLIFLSVTVISWLILILASVNVGGLLLVHFLSRLPELATRTALGSSKSRLFGAIWLQTVLLVLVAFVLAHAVSSLWLPHFEALLHNGENIPLYVRFQFRASMIWQMVLACVVSCTMVTLPVLLRLRERVLINQLRGNSLTQSGIGRMGVMLMLVQCAISVGAVLFAVMAANGAQSALNRDYGVQGDGIAVAAIGGSNPLVVGAAVQRIADKFRQLPEVALISVSQAVPQIGVLERDVQVGDDRKAFNFAPVDEQFATIYQIKLRDGEWISAAHIAEHAPVCVLDMTAAIAAFGNADVIGREITIFDDEKRVEKRKIIGITETVALDFQQGADTPSMFVPVQFDSPFGYFIHVRTKNGDSKTFAGRMQELAASADRSVALRMATDYQDWFEDRAFGFKLIVAIFAPMGALALWLAATGLAGLFGSLVAKRMRDTAIRRSLGASGMAVLIPLLRPLVIAALIGIALGLLIAWPLSMGFNEMMFGGNALGWSTAAYALSVIVFGLLLACVLPARRALRADPNLILKQE